MLDEAGVGLDGLGWAGLGWLQTGSKYVSIEKSDDLMHAAIIPKKCFPQSWFYSFCAAQRGSFHWLLNTLHDQIFITIGLNFSDANAG